MVKLLDCTIRDGGHLNGWNFTKECVSASYFSAQKAGADIFEIGYRYEEPNSDWGDFAKCDDDFLMSFIEKSEKCKISLMIDAGKCSIDKFRDCTNKNTIVDIVRVATYPDNIETALELTIGLKKKGYEVFLNLMTISEYKEEHFEKIKNWQNKDVLTAVCFADSFGAFLPGDVMFFGDKIRSLGFKNICFHSHNNLQLAFANSLRAIEENFYCIDASIYGMGRGAGNLPAEIITGYFNKFNKEKYNPVPYMEVIKKYYLQYFNQNPWGYSTGSLVGGLKNIHPDYVNNLFEHNKFSINEIWQISDLIKQNAHIYFDVQDLTKILEKNKKYN